MREYFPKDIPLGKIHRLHQHSDNASQHLKNTEVFDFLTCLHNQVALFAGYVYTFGAPGHGKGPWDGIGGQWKNKVEQCSSSSKSQGRLAHTYSGYIQTVIDMWMALMYHSKYEGQKNSQLGG